MAQGGGGVNRDHVTAMRRNHWLGESHRGKPMGGGGVNYKGWISTETPPGIKGLNGEGSHRNSPPRLFPPPHITDVTAIQMGAEGFKNTDRPSAPLMGGGLQIPPQPLHPSPPHTHTHNMAAPASPPHWGVVVDPRVRPLKVETWGGGVTAGPPSNLSAPRLLSLKWSGPFKRGRGFFGWAWPS